MKTFALLILLLSFAYVEVRADDPSPPGHVLKQLMLDSKTYTDPEKVRNAFDEAQQRATDPREKTLIRLVGDIEACIFQPESQADPYKSCALKANKKRYGEYSGDFVNEVNRRLKIDQKKIGPAVYCVIQELQGFSDGQYKTCLKNY